MRPPPPYQVEGAGAEDGRTPSIWDTFARRQGAVRNADTGDIAADHYHRYTDDVALMADSACPRTGSRCPGRGCGPAARARPTRPASPSTTGSWTNCCAKGIPPVATAYHWDLPQELEDAGGWTNRDTAYRFAEYVAMAAARLGDRVTLWSTLNEPWCSAFLGYASGVHAPGRQEPARRTARRAPPAAGPRPGRRRAARAGAGAQVSLVLNLHSIRPVTTPNTDAAAVHRVDGLANRIFLEPVLRGHYPADVLDAHRVHLGLVVRRRTPTSPRSPARSTCSA